MDKSRNIAFDILRIIAAFSVVMLNVASLYIISSGVNDFDFKAANFYDSINRYGVPVFVLLSGALFLDKEKEMELKRLWLHNILRIFIIYVIWNYAYYVYQSIFVWQFDFAHQSVLRTITGIVYGTNHLWYLGVIIGLYAITPVLKTWLSKATKQNIEYFLFLFVVFNILNGTITLLLGSSLVSKISSTFKPIELAGYLGYYVFGYYLANYELPVKLRYAIYATVPIDVAFNFLVSDKMTMDAGQYSAGIYDSFGMFTFLEVLAIFLAVTNFCKKVNFKRRTAKFLGNLASDTFGVYLMGGLVLNVIFSENVFFMARPAAVWAIPIALGVFMACSVISALLRRIPYVGRYLC